MDANTDFEYSAHVTPEVLKYRWIRTAESYRHLWEHDLEDAYYEYHSPSLYIHISYLPSEISSFLL